MSGDAVHHHPLHCVGARLSFDGQFLDGLAEPIGQTARTTLWHICYRGTSYGASDSQVIPAKYFDWVFDRFRHLDQFKVFYWDASHGAEFFDPADPAKHELHQGPKAAATNFNRQV
jgi:hypothetical protein